MRVAVCDDNKAMLDFLCRKISEKIQRLFPEYNLCKYADGMSFLTDHQHSPFDMVFLDIKMPDLNGFDVAKTICGISKKTCIVFISTESQLVYDSFKYRPFAFIPKLDTDYISDRLDDIINQYASCEKENLPLVVEIPHSTKRFLKQSEIIYISSLSNYINIVCEKETIRIRTPLGGFIEKLSENNFSRTHNRFAANLSHVVSVDTAMNEVKLDNGELLPISRKYKQSFTCSYENFTKEVV